MAVFRVEKTKLNITAAVRYFTEPLLVRAFHLI